MSHTRRFITGRGTVPLSSMSRGGTLRSGLFLTSYDSEVLLTGSRRPLLHDGI